MLQHSPATFLQNEWWGYFLFVCWGYLFSHSHLKKEDGMIKPILGSDLVIGNRIPVIKKSPIIDYEFSHNDIMWMLSEKGIFSRVLNKGIVIQKKYVKKLSEAFEENKNLMKYL